MRYDLDLGDYKAHDILQLQWMCEVSRKAEQIKERKEEGRQKTGISNSKNTSKKYSVTQ